MPIEIIRKNVYALLRYFELFDHVLKRGEVFALLPHTQPEIQQAVETLLQERLLVQTGDYLHLPGKQWCLPLREQAEKRFEENTARIRRCGWVLSHVPFVRGVFLIGATAKGVMEPGDDFDFMVVTTAGHLWLCKALITLWRKLISRNYRQVNFKYYCCNYMLDTEGMALPEHNPFIALELAFCRPVYAPQLLQQLLATNPWFQAYFRAQPQVPDLLVKHRWAWLQRVGEMLLAWVWNPARERHLLVRYYRHWRSNGTVANQEEFERRACLHWVKGDSGPRQHFLLEHFLHPESPEPRYRLRTRWLLRQAAQGATEPAPELLLTHAHYLKPTRLEKKVMQPDLPRASVSLAAYLRRSGFDVKFLDTTFWPGPGAFSNWLVRGHTALVGIYVLETTRPHALEMMAACRAMGTLVLVAGPDPSRDPDFYLEHGAHLVVVGAGEQTVHCLLQELKNPTRDLALIPGLRLPGRTPAPAPLCLRYLKSLPVPAGERNKSPLPDPMRYSFKPGI